jgi:mono/diheme cytochrome c family protein
MSDFDNRSIVRSLGVAGAVCLLAGLAAGGPQASSPQASSPPEGRAVHGKTDFRIYCASCHGATGVGDGKLAQYLTIKPADLTRLAERNDGDFPAEHVRRVVDGRQEVRGHAGDMPVWGDVFQNIDVLENEPRAVRDVEVARKIADLVAFLRSIQVAE